MSGRSGWRAATIRSSTCSTDIRLPRTSHRRGRPPQRQPPRSARRSRVRSPGGSGGVSATTTTTSANVNGRAGGGHRSSSTTTTTLPTSTTTSTVPASSTTDDPIDVVHDHDVCLRRCREHREHREHHHINGDPSVTPMHRTEPRPLAPFSQRRRVTLTFVALMAVLGVAASACGNSGPSEGALAGKSATAIVSISIKAYHRQKSVSFVTRTVAGKASTVQVGATSEEAASESVRSSTLPVLQALLVDGTAYLRAGSQFLEQQLSMSTAQAAAHAGQWISFQKGNPGYSSITQSLSAGEAIVSFVPEEPNLRVAGATSLRGPERGRRHGQSGLVVTRWHHDHRHTFRLDGCALPTAGRHRPGGRQRRAQRREGGFGVWEVQPEDRPQGAHRCHSDHFTDLVLIGGGPSLLGSVESCLEERSCRP